MKYFIKLVALFCKIYPYAMMGFVVYVVIIAIYSMFHGVSDIFLKINK
jgi:hypothetical protein